MNSAPKIFVFLLFAASLTACVSNNTANSQNRARNTANSNSKTNPAKDDVEELEMTIKLPVRPEEAVWREESLGKDDNRASSPNEKKLIAVLKFTKDGANQIAAQAEKYKPGAPSKISAENWFPNELIAQSQTSGDETLKGTTYAANDFFQAPYLDGKITRIESADYFVLELFSK